MENALAADPAESPGTGEGYGTMPAGWPGTLPLYRLYHTLELWGWFAQLGRTASLPYFADAMRQAVR